MKIADIVLKDLRQFFSHVFSLLMMFIAPLMIPTIMFLAFGSSGGSGFNLPVVQVALVNQDQADAQVEWSASQEVVNYLKGEEAGELISVVETSTEEEARLAIKNKAADVAVLIPTNFSRAALTPGENAEITLISEPTITIGPQIAGALIQGFIDGLSGAKIAVQVATHQMEERGQELGGTVAMQLAERYVKWVQASAHPVAEEAMGNPVRKVSPMEAPSDFNSSGRMVSQMMAAMIIFFVFFTGANGASMIIREEEDGTLQRLFTTPSRLVQILGGKSLAVLITLVIQTLLLTLVASLVFGIALGALASLVLSMLGLVVAAAGFGLFSMSFIRNSRQIGVVLGGAMTILAMIGGLFSAFVADMPPALNTIALLTPHGWAAKAMRLAMAGAQPAEVLLPAVVLLGLGVLFFLAGMTIFRRRFA